jgi:DNA/RNA endonuclease YhcR with UshA esterase domain
VIHYGFNKDDVINKFSTLINSNEFMNYNIFKNQIHQEIDRLLLRATKFTIHPITNKLIVKIINSIKISSNVLLEDEDIEVNKEVRVEKGRGITKLQLTLVCSLFIIIVLIFSFTQFYKMKSNEKASVSQSASVSSVNDVNIGKEILLKLKVEQFNYDKNSGVKSLVLGDTTSVINAVIDKNIKVPFIEEGKTYTFQGILLKSDGSFTMKVKKVLNK